MSRARLVGILAAVATMAWVAAPAGAEPVLELGHGQDPSAVTDAAGTLHVVWRDLTEFQRPLRYCAVPAGGSGCVPVDITHDRDSRGRPHLLLRPQDGALIVVFAGSDPTLDEVTKVMVSADGGATWSAPVPVGAGMPEVDDAQLSPDGAFIDTVGQGDLDEMLYQRVSVGGGVEGRVVPLGREQNGFLPQLSQLADGRPVVVGHYVLDQLGTRVPAAGADPNVPAAWSPFGSFSRLRRAYAPDGDGGPTGAWLLSYVGPRSRTTGAFPVRIWRWGAHGFVSPRSIGALGHRPGSDLGQSEQPVRSDVALDVDLAGRLHAAWPLLPRNCGGVLCIVYRRTDRRGFGPPIVYPVGRTAPDTVLRFGLAANSGGSGWLVWSDHADRIRATPLVTPPLGSRVGSRRVGRRRVTVPDFYGCVPPGGTFVHRLRVDGRRGARILSVRFFFDAGQPARTDRRAPFRIAFRLGFPAGSRHVAGAIVRYRLPGSARVRSVRLGRTFVMC